MPPHRVLAINRGEKAKVLRVKIEADVEAMQAAVDELVVPAEHPHADFLRGCGRDALARLVLPSLEREVRRELTEWAETHAVEVFARNLRNLLLQRRCAAGACWRSIRASRAAASWRCSTSSATCSTRP